MRLPTSSAEGWLSSAINSHVSETTLTRPSKTTGPTGGTESTSDVTVDMWVFDPNEMRQDTEYGDRLTGSLGGLCQSDADVQVNDRLTYQGRDYEVAETMTYDGQFGDVYTLVNFERMEN